MSIFLPINEVYFGKSKSILEMEKQLDIFRNKYMGENKHIDFNINADPDLLKLDRMFEEEFGFGVFNLHILWTPILNSCTMQILDTSIESLTIGGMGGSDVIIKNGTYKYKKELNYTAIVYAYSSVVFNPTFTTGEVMAIILHEVGHNFNRHINKIGVLSQAYYFIRYINNFCSLYRTILFMNSTHAVIENINKQVLEKAPEFAFIFDIKRDAENLKFLITKYPNFILNLLSGGLFSFTKIPTFLLSNIYNIFKKLTTDNIFFIIFYPLEFILQPSYFNEKTADNFATMYGYAPELLSGLHKLAIATNNTMIPQDIAKIYNNTLFGKMYNFNNAILRLLFIAPFDEHPAEISRAQNQLDLLKHELNSEKIDPKMKRVIEKDIEECEKQLDKYYDISNKLDPETGANYVNVLQRKIFGKNYRTMKDIIFDTDPNKRFDDIDAKYEILKNKS